MNAPERITSIAMLHKVLGMERPAHPLISVFDFNSVRLKEQTILRSLITDFYIIALKKDCAGNKFRYGQDYYDFEQGIMYFLAPQQVMHFTDILLNDVEGFVLVVHPDFLHSYGLGTTIREYGYFAYSSNEALNLSEKEEGAVMAIIHNIEREVDANMDAFTHDLLVSNLQLLLTYSDRFYHRQFLTSRKANSAILSKLENILDTAFGTASLLESGVPSVQSIAEQLNLSPNYLSDLLRVQTGQTTQQHIQDRLIAKAKELLSTTTLSISEIAYQLGFEHPQSFHRLFKNRTSISPVKFRASFN